MCVIQQKEKKMDWISKIALTLLIIGGLNWGIVGLSNYDLVALLFGKMSWLSRLIYILVGLSAVWVGFTLLRPTPEVK